MQIYFNTIVQLNLSENNIDGFGGPRSTNTPDDVDISQSQKLSIIEINNPLPVGENSHDFSGVLNEL